MQGYKLLDCNSTDEWKSYLELLPPNQQDIYFTPEFYRLYELIGDGKACCFVFMLGDDLALYPFLKNNINSLGFDLDKKYFDIQGVYGYNGVVSSSLDENFVNPFHIAFHEFCIEENIIAEFSRFHPLLENHLFSINHLEVELNRMTVYLDLSLDENQIWLNSFSSKNRNMIRKSMKADISIREAKCQDDYDEFIHIYHETMSNLNAGEYYYFEESYYDNYFKLINNHQKLFLAEYQGNVIAGAMFMYYHPYVHYHLAGRKKDFTGLPASNLLLDFAIKEAKQIDYHYFFLGGGNNGLPDNSLFKFKAGFSRTYKEFYTGKKIHNQEIYDQTVEQWKQKYPKKKDLYSNMLLKYRA